MKDCWTEGDLRAYLDRELPAADRDRRYTGWRTVAASLGSLDQEFGRDKPDVFSRLCSFIAGHAAELRQHGAEG